MAVAGALAVATVGCSSQPAREAGSGPSAPPARPLSGTAAEGWADDAAGFGAVPTEPPAGVTPRLLEVAGRYAVKNMEAALLDPAVVHGQDLSPVYQALGTFTGPDLKKNIDGGAPPYNLASQFAPGFQPDGPTKIRGTWKVDSDTKGGFPLVLTWIGTAVHQVKNADGKRGAARMDRRFVWKWNANSDGYPAYYTNLSGDLGIDICATLQEGYLVPSLDMAGLVEGLKAPATEAAFTQPAEAPDCPAASPAATPAV